MLGSLRKLGIALAAMLPVVAAHASDFSQPWKNPDRALVIDAYEYNPINWGEMTKDKRIVGFINKASDGLPPPYFCSGDTATVDLCKTKWRRHAVAQELYQTRRALAQALGLKWGAYHLGRPGNPIQQADNFLSFARPGPDDLMAIDIEENDPTKWMSLADAEIFSAEIKRRTGRWPILYTNGRTAQDIAEQRDLYPILSRLPLWYARYKPEIGIHFPKGNWQSYALWQFSAQANCGPKACPYRVAGAKNDIDVNVAPMSADQLRAAWPFGTLVPESEMLVAETSSPSIPLVPLPIWREAAIAGNAEIVLASVAGEGPSLMERLGRWVQAGRAAAQQASESIRTAVNRARPVALPEPIAYATLATPPGKTPAMDALADPQFFRQPESGTDPVTSASIAPVSAFRRDDFPVFLLEPVNGAGENFEDLFRRAREDDLATSDNNRALDQNRMSQHEINQLIVAPAWVVEPELIIGRVLAPEQVARR